MGDGASEILNAISPRRFYEKLHARNQERAYGWVKRHELTSIENQATINAGTPVVLSDDWDTVRRRSSSRKRHVATLGNFLTTTAAHASRLAQGTLDIIIIPPMEISLTLSKSFRNAPLVFHDDTVRTSPRVIGVRSGLRAAGNVRMRPGLESSTMERFNSNPINLLHRSSSSAFMTGLAG